MDRVLILSAKARELLLKFSAFTRDRKRVCRPKQLTDHEFKELCQQVCKDGFISLADLLLRLQRQTGRRLAPEEFQVFFSEIARNSPACGLAQIRGNEDVISMLKAVAEGSLDILARLGPCPSSFCPLPTPLPLPFFGMTRVSSLVKGFSKAIPLVHSFSVSHSTSSTHI